MTRARVAELCRMVITSDKGSRRKGCSKGDAWVRRWFGAREKVLFLSFKAQCFVRQRYLGVFA